jgi:hypothetical protein
VSEHETIDLPAIRPLVERHRRLSVRCPSRGTLAIAPVPAAANGTPFGPRIHAGATDPKTFQALSHERPPGAFADLLGLPISQAGLMNMLRRSRTAFAPGRDAAVAAPRRAKVVAHDETHLSGKPMKPPAADAPHPMVARRAIWDAISTTLAAFGGHPLEDGPGREAYPAEFANDDRMWKRIADNFNELPKSARVVGW